MTKARIMVVEDEGLVALSLQMKLEEMGYEVPAIVASGEEAIQQAAAVQPDLALMDIMLAGKMDGIETAGHLRAHFQIPIVYLTANTDANTLQRAKISQPFGYLLKPFSDKELPIAIEIALYKHQMEQELEQYRHRLEEMVAERTAALVQVNEQLQQSHIQLTQAYDETLMGWSRALELYDKETSGHSRRVTEMAVRLARAMDFSEEELVHVRRGALLHDIGKMAIPDGILLKPESLTNEEREIMQQHPSYAYQMLAPITYLHPALDIPYCHHERWDGDGYPRGLKGEQIPLSARIFAVVDVWDALRSDRPYHAAWPEEKALTYICKQAGRQFDPQVVEVFIQVVKGDLEHGQAAHTSC